MNRHLKQIILLYLIIVLLKVGLSYFILAPSAFSDDYGFIKVARSFFYEGEFSVHGHMAVRPPLYAIILSPAYIARDMGVVFLLMKIINALVSSSIIFAIWLLSKEFLDEKKSMGLAILAAVLPSHFSFTFFFMAENLFYPLFLFSAYFIYKSFIEKSYKWDALAGIFIGLTCLTKVNAVALIFAVFIAFIFKLFRKEYWEIPKKVVMAFAFFITITPWLIRVSALTGLNKELLSLGYGRSLGSVASSLSSSREEFLLVFITWMVIYSGYLMIASGFSFFISSFSLFYQKEDKNARILFILTFSSALCLILMASKSFKVGVFTYKTSIPWLAGRIIGRYVEAVLPLILLTGLLGLKYMKKNYWAYYVSVPVLIISSQLVFFPLFPINNMSLTGLGILKLGMDFLIYRQLTFTPIFSDLYSLAFIVLLFALLLFVVYIQKKWAVQKILHFFIVFFFIVALANFAGVYYNSYTFWYQSEQTQLGLWFNKYDPEISTVLFDERDGCKIFKTNQTCIYNPFVGGGSATIMGFWMNDEIKIGSVENLENVDYVVSKHKLNLPILKETKNGIFLYKVNKEN